VLAKIRSDVRWWVQLLSVIKRPECDVWIDQAMALRAEEIG